MTDFAHIRDIADAVGIDPDELNRTIEAFATNRHFRAEFERRANNRYASGREIDAWGNAVPVGLSYLGLDSDCSVEETQEAILERREAEPGMPGSPAYMERERMFAELLAWIGKRDRSSNG